ncbi:MAG: hypothetical protein CFH26_00213 [Alphaproteobacteria bacterium MarineAlpha6_Bin4]|nr:MAG: hypothetical protein CFH26_00213 [Alphaproteobacteria bacterium MarineAlpha6_Bin4]|tara:strand:+ start:25 stop:969 length:945 start_codon:yes stop_codon:yes gene_type:complete
MLKNTIQIITPSRLHFGFIELNNSCHSKFGGIGLSIDKFHTKIIIKKNTKMKLKSKVSNKAQFFLTKFCKKNKIKSNFSINIEKSSPQHIGLGSGTQLALSIGTAISNLNNINLNIEEIAKILNRSSRSNVGLINFKHGGFLIDLKISNKFYSNIDKVFFPEEWKIILVKDNDQGLHGKNEMEAFKKLKSLKKNNINLASLVLLEIYPSIIENNFDNFSKAITKLQNEMSKKFKSFQGGKFSSISVGNVLKFLKKKNVKGYGQTSWGPSGFAFFPNIEKAKQMQKKLIKRFSSCKNLEFIICSVKNSGADIQFK